MGLGLALKAFFKAWKEPEKAKTFIEEIPPQLENVPTAHLKFLALLQQSSRLVDFLKEDITAYNDAQVGAAARKIHQDCSKCMEELLAIRPVLQDAEGAKITVPKGYDPAAIKVVGQVKGEPPYRATIVHSGWKAHKRSLPKMADSKTEDIICPAEVEVC